MGNVLKRHSKYWVINKNFLLKQLKKRGIDKYNYTLIKKYIKREALNNSSYLIYLVKKFRECENPRMSFDYHVTEEDTFIDITITLEYVLKFLNEKKYSNKLNKKLLERIIYYSNPEYINKKLLSKQIIDKLTYKDLVSFLVKDPKETNIEKKEEFFGYNGEQFLEILSTYPLFLDNRRCSILNKLILSEEEWKNIERNYNKIKYKYEKDKFSGYQLEPFRSVVDEFELNPELEKSIMKEIPPNFNKLQSAYYIYRRLCQKFTYDEMYFYLKNQPKDKSITKHMDITYLSTLKGGEDVICSGISLIYAKFLDKLKISFRITDYQNENVETLSDKHMKVLFKIDDYVISADGAHGLHDSDMVNEKIKGEVKNFEIANTSQKMKNSFLKELMIVDKYIKENEELIEYKDAKEAYKNIKSNSYENISIEERVNLLIDIIESIDMKFFDMINFIDSIQYKIFGSNDENYKVEFIVNLTKEPKLNILIVYNDQKIELDPQSNNYIVITPDKKREVINYEELKLRFEKSIYDFTSPKRNILDLKGKSENIDEGFYIK